MNEGPFVIRVNCGGQFLLNPGSGRDLKVSLGALVAIDAAHAMIDAGIPVRVIGPYTSLFALRALELLQLANAFNIEPSALSRDDFARAPPDFRRNEWLLCFPVAEREGEWRAFIFYDGVPFRSVDLACRICGLTSGPDYSSDISTIAGGIAR